MPRSCGAADKALPQPRDHVALEQPRVPLVDRLDLEFLLVAGEVQVVLAVHLADEPLAVAGVTVEVERQGHARIRA